MTQLRTPEVTPAVRPVERLCYTVGVVLFAAGLLHVGLLLVTGDSWTGPVSFRKPATFGLSFGLTLVTIAWVASYLSMSRRVRAGLLGVFAVACVVEVFLISLQAWRGVPSHFNLETGFDGLVARLLAVGGVVLVAVIVALTVVAWRGGPGPAAPMRLAIRAGLVALDGSLLVGAAMIAAGMTRVAGGDQQGAYTVGGALKPAHAVLMHGVLVLPALAWLMARSGWPERRQERAMRLAVTGYAVLCAAVLAVSAVGFAAG